MKNILSKIITSIKSAVKPKKSRNKNSLYQDHQFYGCTSVADIEQRIRDIERKDKLSYF